MRRGAKPRKAKVGAKRPRARTLSKEEAAKRHALEKRLAESLEREKATAAILKEKDRALTESLQREAEEQEQQTATAEILRVISRSPTDIRPVLNAVAESAARLCESSDTEIFRRDGDRLLLVAHRGPIPSRALAVPLIRGAFNGRAVLDGRTLHVADLQSETHEFPQGSEFARQHGTRAQLSVPLMREGTAIGTISLRRTEARLFTERQVALLQTFAAQAVIAIENVRLFNETKEALDQQTATSEILGVISSSPTDVQPVFESLVTSAARLCGANDLLLLVREADVLRPVAGIGSFWGSLADDFRVPLVRGSVAARSVIDGTTLHFPDLAALSEAEFPAGRDLQLRFGHRTVLAVPLVREGRALGTIFALRFEVRPFADQQIALLKTFADQAVIAIENVRLFQELQARNRDLTEALEQQTATGEILQVISSSPIDLQPVMDAVVRSAARFCGAPDASIFRLDGAQLRADAHHGPVPQPIGLLIPVVRGTVGGRTVLERQAIHVPDLQAATEEFPEGSAFARQVGHRTTLSVPLLREGVAIGVIQLRRAEVNAFTDKQISLLQTFADQAVIAIENVRLFTELEARNRDLTATSEILRVISRSPTDVQPVFDAIAAAATTLCAAENAGVFLFDGTLIHFAAHHHWTAKDLDAIRQTFPRPPGPGTVTARAILTRAVAHTADIAADPGYELRGFVDEGFRAILSVPMLRDGDPIGAISVTRREAVAFTDKQIALLKTFADQAVIAIENVRLFTELQERNRAVTQAHAQVSEALEQQTATAEILRVISRSQTDVRPVFDTIVRSAVRLCAGLFSALFQFDGELIHQVAHHNFTPEALEAQHRVYPTRPSRGLGAARAILDRAVVHIPDVEVDPEFQHQAVSRAIGWRSGLFVPMLREGAPIGVIMVARAEPGPFSGNEIELLNTFADQAVIAVENARLFKELQARTGELTKSVEKLTALGEVSHALSSTLDVETVLNTIVSRASQLAGAAACAIFEYDEDAEQFELRATYNYDAEFVEALRAAPLRKGEGLMGRAAEMREPVQVPDITQPGAYQSSLRETLIRFGYRALLSVPLLREDQIIGSLSFNRKAPGEFNPEVIDVLKTFATQSALAIQNARLFREIADKSRQLEAASRHKSEFLANMSHELRTPLNAIIGFSEVLVDRMFGELNEKQDEYLKDIYASGQHLLSLINDILDLSKIEAGRMELEATDFDLPSAIDNALILVRERASRRGITLGHTIDERLGPIRGDERKVKQVLLNLLSNALKFTPEGGRIDVRARVDDGVAEIAVTDTGVGIAPEDQEVVFEEFRQVGTADKKVEGTGLGLALSRKFIELHGGRIWVESEMGKGSTFRFTLPVRRGG